MIGTIKHNHGGWAQQECNFLLNIPHHRKWHTIRILSHAPSSFSFFFYCFWCFVVVVCFVCVCVRACIMFMLFVWHVIDAIGHVNFCLYSINLSICPSPYLYLSKISCVGYAVGIA